MHKGQGTAIIAWHIVSCQFVQVLLRHILVQGVHRIRMIRAAYAAESRALARVQQHSAEGQSRRMHVDLHINKGAMPKVDRSVSTDAQAHTTAVSALRTKWVHASGTQSKHPQNSWPACTARLTSGCETKRRVLQAPKTTKPLPLAASSAISTCSA